MIPKYKLKEKCLNAKKTKVFPKGTIVILITNYHDGTCLVDDMVTKNRFQVKTEDLESI